ncbi:MAG: LysM peptidoglycan-binding domain-containing protein [Sodalis sp. (in: enterobacteria)]
MRGNNGQRIATHYGVSPGAIKRANNMTSNNVMLGQPLPIPPT